MPEEVYYISHALGPVQFQVEILEPGDYMIKAPNSYHYDNIVINEVTGEIINAKIVGADEIYYLKPGKYRIQFDSNYIHSAYVAIQPYIEKK